MLIHYIILFHLFVVTWEAASNSYDDCLKVAALFATTVSNGPVANITATTGVNVTCSGLTGSSCPGSVSNGLCVFQQKLCVTCINSSPVRIRIQSNGLPRRCTVVPSGALIAELNIDFEVNFNPDVSVKSPNQSPTTVAEISNLLCNLSSEATVPSASGFIQHTNLRALSVISGIALDGVSIFNVNSANQVDPFYPTGGFPTEGADQCLSHPGGDGEFHYHVGSGCVKNSVQGTVSSCSPEIGCLNNVANYSISTFSSLKNLTVIGVAKDGHLVYGPYLSSGALVTSGFDVCNGMFYDSIGNYAYFVTNTYPYVIGCLGPGNYPNVKPNCTTNPPASYTMSSYAAIFAAQTSIGGD